MKSIQLNTPKIEALLFGLIWLLVFAMSFAGAHNAEGINLEILLRQWIHLGCYLLVFLLNAYWLVPRLLFNKKYWIYSFIVLVCVVFVTSIDVLLNSLFHMQNNIPSPGLPPDRGPKPLIVFLLDNFIFIILIISVGAASKLITKWLSEEKLRKDIEKDQLKTNLALLRHQVSPHFFMNTLNNIHSLIAIDSEKAQNSVERLSTLMRYLLYDSAQNTIELKKEIEFINSFISLMELRHSDEVEIKVVVPQQIPVIKIPPMLFISLLENAFKHGVNYPHRAYIYFELQILDNSLKCVIKNSKHKAATNNLGEYSGIGLPNIKKSLKLLYEDDYELIINDKENEYEVNLKIPL